MTSHGVTLQAKFHAEATYCALGAEIGKQHLQTNSPKLLFARVDCKPTNLPNLGEQPARA